MMREEEAHSDFFTCEECGARREKDSDLHDIDGRDLCGDCFNLLVDEDLEKGE